MHMRMCEYVPAQAHVHALMFKAECCYAVLADLEFANNSSALVYKFSDSRSYHHVGLSRPCEQGNKLLNKGGC